jgi:hypothetical protein
MVTNPLDVSTVEDVVTLSVDWEKHVIPVNTIEKKVNNILYFMFITEIFEIRYSASAIVFL